MLPINTNFWKDVASTTTLTTSAGLVTWFLSQRLYNSETAIGLTIAAAVSTAAVFANAFREIRNQPDSPGTCGTVPLPLLTGTAVSVEALGGVAYLIMRDGDSVTEDLGAFFAGTAVAGINLFAMSHFLISMRNKNNNKEATEQLIPV